MNTALLKSSLDEQAILKFKRILEERVTKFSQLDHLDEQAFKEWMALHGIRYFRHDWVCINFLDPNHVMVKVQHAHDSYSTIAGYLLVPKDLVDKSLVIGYIP